MTSWVCLSLGITLLFLVTNHFWLDFLQQSQFKRVLELLVMNVLSIAGSDPSSGAGIQNDIKTFSLLDAYGLAVITAVP